MATYKVSVKWGKEKFTDVEIYTSEPTEVFKAQLMALTGVEPDRQKVMLKGAQLKDSWDSLKGLKDGVTLLLMGSATAVPEAPAVKTVFVEDMNEQQLASHLKMPSGLVNLGNTCYMNATVQCLRSVPELSSTLAEYKPSAAGSFDVSTSITQGLRQLVSELEKSSESVTPLMFLNIMFASFPQFAERGEGGGFTQQDANECWTALVGCLQQSLYRTGKSSSFVDEYLRVQVAQTMKCLESEEESATESTEKHLQLSCHIDKDVKYLQTGLQSFLKEHIEKFSPGLNRNAQYEKSCQISRLPAYLAIQFVRFQYKGNKGVNAKILKDVKFTINLDMYEFCTPELQKKLNPMRQAMKAEEDKQLEAVNEAKLKGEPLKKEKKTAKKPFSFDDDEGSNNSGYYELQAVLTHKGRDSSSGHYVAWVRDKGDDWFMYDDDRVAPVKAENILELSGGGDWHTAYVLLYKPKILEVEIEGKAEPMQE